LHQGTQAAKSSQIVHFVGKDAEMPARFLVFVGFALITLGSAAQVSADMLCDAWNSIVRDVKRRQCWPEPFVAPDRATVRAPFVKQVANGWRRENMLGQYHFDPDSGQLNEAGRNKVRWILTGGPQQHRIIYVHTADKDGETTARVAAVRQWASQISPEDVPAVQLTTISEDGWPVDEVEAISRKYRSSMPEPRLPDTTSGDSGSTTGGGSQP
jgi:hypothetical protein